MKSEIALIAESVLANCRILELLIAKLPDAVQVEVAKEVAKVNPTPVQPVVQEAPAPTPVTVPTAAPITAPAVPAPAPSVPPTPVVAAPTAGASVPTAAPAPVATDEVPFKTHREMTNWIMAQYKEMGMEKGKLIQNVLNEVGSSNINEVNPAHYAALYAGVMKLKAS